VSGGGCHPLVSECCLLGYWSWLLVGWTAVSLACAARALHVCVCVLHVCCTRASSLALYVRFSLRFSCCMRVFVASVACEALLPFTPAYILICICMYMHVCVCVLFLLLNLWRKRRWRVTKGLAVLAGAEGDHVEACKRPTKPPLPGPTSLTSLTTHDICGFSLVVSAHIA
jgi:hypothetical protein